MPLAYHPAEGMFVERWTGALHVWARSEKTLKKLLMLEFGKDLFLNIDALFRLPGLSHFLKIKRSMFGG